MTVLSNKMCIQLKYSTYNFKCTLNFGGLLSSPHDPQESSVTEFMASVNDTYP